MVGVDVCQLVKSALRGRILVATGVSVDVIGQASLAAWRAGLRGGLLDKVVVGRPPLMELRLEVRRERWWAKAAAASGNMAWIVEGSKWREFLGDGLTGGGLLFVRRGVLSKDNCDIAEFNFCCIASKVSLYTKKI
jgi:hypothetical protein